MSPWWTSLLERLFALCSLLEGVAHMTAQDREPVGTPEKDPADWTTGDEPMTGPQVSYLQTLAHQAGREVPEGLSKAQASALIDELQQETGRGAQ